MRRWATNLQKLVSGFSMKLYISVTRSRTSSFLTSGVNFLSSIAFIIDGRHLVGIEKAGGNLSALLETVEITDWIGEDDRVIAGSNCWDSESDTFPESSPIGGDT
jgi:hypothetical protein